MSKKKKQRPDLHYFYEASVQGVDWDIDFAARIFKNKRKRQPLDLREDFCGTAKLACEWVGVSPKRRAWGVDIDQSTLDWAAEHNLPHLGKKAGQLELVCGDVLTAQTPPADLVMALNFSYCCFKTRDLLRAYFEAVHRTLKDDGIFVIDLYGGTEAIEAKVEPRDVAASTAKDGTRVPEFEYIWDQAEFNVIDHHVINHIHFKIPEFGKIKKAFTYDWRLWTLPEIQELLLEAGFKTAEVYLHGWTDDGKSDDTYKKRTTYENSLGWVAYISGIK